MIGRLLKPLKKKSFFIFGARGTGKTSFLRQHFDPRVVQYYDLLDLALQDEIAREPARFKQLILQQGAVGKHIVVIDEIQKIPRLLDTVHQLIETKKYQFALTGSSARRLKQKGTNLLAGRALVYELFPFTSVELGAGFDLSRALQRGTLPEAYLADTDETAAEYLRTYALTYLEKEVQQEQWVRNLDAFRRFLPVASQMNGQIINRSKIARDVGVDDMTVGSYFEILEDTLMGFTLPAYNRSIRKQQHKASKFYLFDTGIKRALERTLRVPLLPQTHAYGEAFEHWLILEIYRLNNYRRLDWRFSYLKTKDQAEIDLIIDRPGDALLLIEIKSKDRVQPSDVKHLESLGPAFRKAHRRLLLTQDPVQQIVGKTTAMHWRDFLQKEIS